VGCSCGNCLLFNTGVDSVLDDLVAQEAVGGNADAVEKEYGFNPFCNYNNDSLFFFKIIKNEIPSSLSSLLPLSLSGPRTRCGVSGFFCGGKTFDVPDEGGLPN
jgi:hypothetical protein